MTGDRVIYEGKGVGRETWPKPKETREVVKRARDAAGARAREIGGIGEKRQQHIRSMKDYLTLVMAGDEAKEALQPFHSAERRCGLLARLGTGSLEDPRLECPYIGRWRREALGRLWGTEGQWSQIAGGV